ncbi:glycoside hydrolase family 31 protein [Mucilaginibacter paludis]|uniref:Glycoside hydrolase family 31 n=1 Tax=Mucilaginibacter paludis DSM 18603 TaxID=714943 RepID=H1YB99_9SPHI|nr:glycoside hydrolase family 31 protein [Mucilaginibacter paludis]EHQ30625.1 glycoside hydrolase family 31 [Mucilaginibacter paludis DSM 18603]
MNIKSCFLIPFALLANCLTFAQTSPVKSVGNITSVAIEGQQVNITTDNAFATIAVYAPNVIRVRIDKQKLAPDFSYAVIAQAQKTQTNITQNTNEVNVVTDSLKVTITKSPFAITFYTPDGKIINQDETGLTTSWVNESVTTYKKMQDGERFVGLGEKTGNLDRKGSGYTNWNTDAFGYSAGQDPIYSTIPFYIGIHHQVNYGIFLDNTYQSDFNFGASNNRFSFFGARGGEMNYYFIYNKRIADIITSYTALTGRMKMPPLWSLGYQQNRYSYYPETEVFRIAQTLREKKIPADGITLDIHYMDHYKVFTWDKDRFPDPKKMNDKLKDMGFKLTVIVDPGVKIEKGYGTYERGLTANIFAKYPDSTNYSGEVWPGWCHFPDFTNPKTRTWWAQEMKTYGADGISGIWNDMNEIASWGQKMPDNIIFDYDGKKASHLQTHNVYGMQMARSSYEGAKEAFGKRPFILTRAGYAGLQRYTAIWTGDNRSEDSHMLAGVRLLNSLGLSGVAFTGMDIGGFTGNPSISLFARWIQIGAFNPYFRNHTAVNTKSAEPWTFGEEVLEISRNYINLRYKLMPYLYSAFYEATQNGQPLMRSLAIDYTFDANIYNEQFQNQYLFGSAFLVAPFEGDAKFGKVYFPAGKWYDLYNGEVQNGGQQKIIQLSQSKLPVYVKESSIIPMQSLVQTTAQKPTDTLTIHVYQGAVKNTYVYYEDDGESYNYEHGDFYKRAITYDAAKNTIVFAKAEGTLTSKFKNIKLMLHGFANSTSFKMNGAKMSITDDFVSFLTPISKFDPQGNANTAEGEKVKSIVIKNINDQFSINF